MRLSGPLPTNHGPRHERLARAARACALLLLLLPVLAACGGRARPQAPTIQVKPVPAANYPRPELLADTAWLAGRLDDPTVRIVDLSPLADYRRGHIPGAVHLWWQDLIEVHNDTYGMLVDPASRKRVLGAAGIQPAMTVVAYDNEGGRYASYLLWVLTYTDYAAGRLLNGGLDTWRNEGRPVTRAVPAVAPTTLADRPTNEAVLYNAKDLLPRLGERDLAIVDVRSTAEVNETWGGRLRLPGRIPNARSIPWERNLGQKGTEVVREPGELSSAVYAGLRPDQEVIVYALTGVEAAHTFWIMRVLGYSRVKLYDGSWAEWGAATPSRPYPVEPPAVGRVTSDE